eukprot:GEMP01018634.1.p1 GENE.GEMP01018634.1~~GEMP01018634.1.p1  ORF type:complete len:731 (+),score=165.48 GEMP01018634.1:109-2301(+)
MEDKDVFIFEILVVILLSLGFEQIQERLDHRFHSMGKKGEKMMLMKETLFGEIMTLGFIGLLVFIMTKTGEAKMLAQRLFPRDELEGEGDPLSETFEIVHMVMFCVMVTFIAQCSLLMVIATRQSAQWERWEATHVLGAPGDGATSFEHGLIKYGYLSKKGDDLIVNKMLSYERTWWPRKSDELLELIQWRAIRHEFMFPSANDTFQTGRSESMLRSAIHNVKEPHFFSFSEYLDEALGEAFVELVEVDLKTWVIAALLCPALHLALSLSWEYHCTLAATLSWTWVAITLAFGVNVSNIYFDLIPDLPTDPRKLLTIFSGTTLHALKKNIRNARVSTQTKGATPSGTPSGKETQDDEDLKRPLVPNDSGPQPATEVVVQVESEGTAPVFAEIKRVPARFRLCESTPLTRPWYIRLGICSKVLSSHTCPNDQQRLFIFHEWGKEFYPFFLELLMFFQAITNASYIVIWCTKDPDGWTALQWSSFCIGVIAPFLNLIYFVPRVVSKLAIICSIEYYKEKEKIEAVVFSQKKKQLLESLQLLRMAKLRGRISRLADHRGKIAREHFQQQSKKFEELSVKKQNEIARVFKMFDADNSGTISQDEMVQVINSMNMAAGSDAADAALQLFNFVDYDNSGHLEIEEFKVLMCLALYQPSHADEMQDILALFKTFDADASGAVSIQELAEYFTLLGVNLHVDEMAELVYSVFKVTKQNLTAGDFVQFMTKLDEMADEN